MPHDHQLDTHSSGAVQAYQHLSSQQANSSTAVAQLFARLSQEIEEHKPKNCIHFIVDFLCKHYPEHLHGFASIWQMDPDLERERHEVVNFFKAHKISTAVAAHFTNAGYDTLDTLTTLSPDSLHDVEAFNNVKWLPGHKVRLQQIFGEISARIRAYKQQYGSSEAGRHPHHHRAVSPRVHHGTGSPHHQERHRHPSYVHPAPHAAHAAAPHVHHHAAPHQLSAGLHGHAGAAMHSVSLHGGLAPTYTPALMAPSGLGHGLSSLQAPSSVYGNHYTVA